MTQVCFIPGIPGAPDGPLARYRPAQPAKAAGAYVQALTQPGDLVVDLFCQGPAFVREIVAAGRRALGFSVNPLLLVAAGLGLSRRERDALNAAFTRLADSPKGDVPLRRYLVSLYHSACPACGTPGVAEWFAWDRDGNYPFRKAVRCPQCAQVQEGSPDDDDLDVVGRIPPQGLAYYYALDRAAPPGHAARERAAELVNLYTPRNLSALMDIAMRLEGLEADGTAVVALTGVLLDCFDAGSRLDPYDEERPRPRTLRVPSRYVERNVWLCFEDRFSRLVAEEVPSPLPRPLRLDRSEHAPVSRAEDVAALVEHQTEGYALVGRPARDVGQVVRPGSVALILADPPRPDGVFWALSALWAGWLWESPAARAMRPFLRRRRFDWDWHHRVLRAALRAAVPLLAANGRLITLFSEPDRTLLESVCLAASGAGYALEGWGYSPEVGYRLVWRRGTRLANGGLQTADGQSQNGAAGVQGLEGNMMAATKTAAMSALQKRGEPTAWEFLHASVYTGLAKQGLLARTLTLPEDGPPALAFAADAVRRGLEAAPIAPLGERDVTEEALWWLAERGQAAEPLVVSSVEPLVVSEVEPPLADRVEEAVWELLAGRPDWDRDELVNAIYARFPGELTPDVTLVRVCIDSYSVREKGELHLRPEDEPERRAAELVALRSDLTALGKRLGFRVVNGDGEKVHWLEEGQAAYVFAVSVTSALASHVLETYPTRADRDRAAGKGLQRCLVLPGGRAQLVNLKLQRDPRLARAVEAGGWQFIKFRHLRRLVAEEELDRHALKTVLGLDPIAEQEAAQIPLF
jgi:hypothetical protein